MPRVAVEDNSRMSLRVRAEEKAMLLRAAALKHTDLTNFVLQQALRVAKTVIAEAEHIQLSERDSLRVLDLLENPPKPNAKLRAAARALRIDFPVYFPSVALCTDNAAMIAAAAHFSVVAIGLQPTTVDPSLSW